MQVVTEKSYVRFIYPFAFDEEMFKYFQHMYRALQNQNMKKQENEKEKNGHKNRTQTKNKPWLSSTLTLPKNELLKYITKFLNCETSEEQLYSYSKCVIQT